MPQKPKEIVWLVQWRSVAGNHWVTEFEGRHTTAKIVLGKKEKQFPKWIWRMKEKE